MVTKQLQNTYTPMTKTLKIGPFFCSRKKQVIVQKAVGLEKGSLTYRKLRLEFQTPTSGALPVNRSYVDLLPRQAFVLAQEEKLQMLKYCTVLSSLA